MTKANLDPRSAEPVVFYVHGQVGDAPAADLSANALARIAWIRAKKRPPYPHDMPQEAIAAVRDELTKDGKYSVKKPEAPSE